MGTLSKDQLSRLSLNVAHDLKSPLRKIRQCSELLKLDYSEVLKGEGEIYLEALTESSSEIGGLVDSLLNYARCLTDSHEFETVDLNRFINEPIRDFQLEYGPDIIIVKTHLPTVKANPKLMVVLFSNLLSNAVRFVGAGIKPNIKISAKNLQGDVVIQVEDNGIGISGIGSDKIFEPLIRLHSKSEFEGFGMGLALCKAICDLHGWSIGYSGNEAGGSTFEVKLIEAI